MDKTIICFVFGPLILLMGLAGAFYPEWIRKCALRYYTGRNPLEKFIPFGGRWMQRHEKEHLLSIRFSGLVGIAMGTVLLYMGFVRLQ